VEPDANLLVTVADAALMLSLSRSRTYELIAAGAIPSVSIGRSRRIPVDGLRDYVARLRQEVDGAAPNSQATHPS